jgi:hypothetical protein
VLVVQDHDQDSTDLMKCLQSLQEKEEADGVDVGGPIFANPSPGKQGIFFYCNYFQTPYDVVLLGGFSGRLDQTVHILSYLHKLRKCGRRLFVVADENVGWVLDEARRFPPIFFLGTLKNFHAKCLLTVTDGVFRANIAFLLTTRYSGRLAGCSPSEWIRPC